MGNAAGHRRRKAILAFIKAYQAEHGYSPTIAEIREGPGPNSPGEVLRHLSKMEADGVIRQTPKVPRSLVVTGEYED